MTEPTSHAVLSELPALPDFHDPDDENVGRLWNLIGSWGASRWPEAGRIASEINVLLYDAMRTYATAAILADRAARGAQAWLPISEAPTDGTAVLVYPPTWPSSKGRTAAIATYDANKYAKKPRPYWYRDDALSITKSRDVPPTHYMPVPEFAAPQLAAEQATLEGSE